MNDCPAQTPRQARTSSSTDVQTEPITSTTGRTWFAIRYTDHAPVGLLPILEADNLFSYTDDADTWLVATWKNADPEPARCILRVPLSHVATSSAHCDLSGAAQAAYA